MKKLFFIAIAITLIGCKNEVKPEYAIISGKITNKQNGDLTINTEDRSVEEKIDVAPDGTFTDTLSTDISSYILFDSKNPVFLKVKSGDNLNITYDATDFENSLVITGNGAEINNYIIAKRKTEMDLSKKSAEIFQKNEADYKTSMLEFKASQEKLLNNTKGLPSDYVEKEKRDLNYGYLSKLNTYERGHQYFTKNQEFKVSDNFLNELKDLDYTNVEDFKFSSNYKGLVNDYYSIKARALSKKDSMSYDLVFLSSMANIEQETIKNTLIFDFANFNIPYSKDVDAFYKMYTENSTNEKNNKLIAEKYNKLTALKKGKPSPKFVDYENHAGGKMSLDDLKGKYVYIDVWATWCGPCIQQIPYLQEVEKKYHDKNIEFVSISIDTPNNHEKWKTMVNEKGLSGIQLIADNNWNSNFVQEYQIQGIPKFILIDAEGNIVDSNAPRPSSEKLIELFNSHNI
ncbi:TlpA disulfide reductase family protein [uncultured Algibacter sp.]|uniref:TlpA family protein disulfide reductase n=1 Tax=uncultured Algibacter sp. TaxID=298659 RepID=UPI00261570CF|nr:TlpA disulfide reductase family protein [uncultured Algibacter sp.]